jgi:hypothetical protein
LGTPAVRQKSSGKKPTVLHLLPHLEIPCQHEKHNYFLDQGLNWSRLV